MHYLVQFQNDWEPPETAGVYASLHLAKRRIEKRLNVDEDGDCREYKYATVEEWHGSKKVSSWEYEADKKCPVFSFRFKSSLIKQ